MRFEKWRQSAERLSDGLLGPRIVPAAPPQFSAAFLRGGSGSPSCGSGETNENPVTQGSFLTVAILHRIAKFGRSKAPSLPIKGLSYELPDRNGAGRSPEDRSGFYVQTANRQPSRRLVFTTDCLICFKYRDPSLALRMTGGRREGKHVTQSNIYRLSSIV